MSQTISIHSFRGGTGKSNTTANLAYLLAASGNRVCAIDTDIQSPGIHVPLAGGKTLRPALNDYLRGEATIQDVAHDVSGPLGLPSGSIHLVPSSMEMGEITRILKEGYDVGTLNEGFKALRTQLNLDYLLIDTHPGLNEETLLSIAISDALILLMRPDQQDFQGTSVTVEVARRLKVERILLVMNKAPEGVDRDALSAQAERAYQLPLAGLLPLSIQMVELGSKGLFARAHPEATWSRELKRVAERLQG